MYATNAIKGFYRWLRKFTKIKEAFTNEIDLFKRVYCACQKIAKNGPSLYKLGLDHFPAFPLL